MSSENMKSGHRNRAVMISIGIIICILLTAGSVLGAGFRVPVTAGAAGFERLEKPVDVDINFTQVLGSIGRAGTIDENSIHVSETNSLWAVVDASVPSQFDKDAGFNPTSKASGTVVFIMEGTTLPSASRYYYIYFDLTGGSSSPVVTSPQITLTDGIVDQGQSSFRVNITNSTLYFQKAAGGFSSWDDKNGNDWIGWSTANASAGKYRGIPNAVNPEEVFHPGFNCCTSTIVSQGPIKIRIKSVNGTKWESIWDFYPRYATMTMTKNDHNYWFLYEGTPGGVFEKNKDFMYRSTGVKTYLNTTWKGDIPNDEWAYFSDPSTGGTGRSLFVTHYEGDNQQDLYWPHTYMTVFGFGRNETNLQKLLSTVPRHFTMGIVDGVNFAQTSKLINSANKGLVITKGVAEQDNGDVGPLSIVSRLPIGDPSTIVGNALTFSVALNKNADVTWSVDGFTTKTDAAVATSSYTNSSAGIGVHTVRVVATNGTDTVSISWIWTIGTNVVTDMQVTHNVGDDRQPMWSPDGQWLTFMTRGPTAWEIRKSKLDGSFLTTLAGGAGGIEPAWGSNDRIAFSRGISDSTMDVFVMNNDGTNVQTLANTAGYDEYPDWNQGATQIAFVSQFGATSGAKYLGVMNADGSNKRNLKIVGIQPAWSPDGTKIAYKCYLGGTNICIVNASGTGNRQLTFNTGNTHNPDWSPDGSKIAYASSQDGDWEIYTINVNGTGKKQLTSNARFEDNYPAWSPDGQYIAYASNRSGDQEIWIMSISGQGIPSTLSITSSSPTVGPTTTAGTSQTFSIALNKNADVTWYVDGSIVKTDIAVVTSSYTNSTAGIGTHVINATAKNDTDTKSREWNWIVQDTVAGITVISPNGGEKLKNGTTNNINWIYSGSVGTSAQIELLKGGVTDSVIIGNTPIGNSGTGSYSWSIPPGQTLGSDYTIRITSTSNPGITDVSNGYFSIISGVVVPTVNLAIAIKNGTGNVEVFRNDSGTWTSLGQTTTIRTFTVEKGVQLKTLATPDTGQIFEKWTTNTGSIVTANPIIANQNWAGGLSAYFNTIATTTTVDLVITIKNGSGSVEVFRNDSGVWTSLGQTTTTKTYTVTRGAQLKMVATPATGQIFEKYVSNIGTVTTTNVLIVNQNLDGSFDTYFKVAPLPTVNLAIAIKNGSGNVEVFRNDSGSWTSLGSTTTSKTYTVVKGVQLQILATPDTGYVFERYMTNTGANVTVNPVIAIQNWAGSLSAYFK